MYVFSGFAIQANLPVRPHRHVCLLSVSALESVSLRLKDRRDSRQALLECRVALLLCQMNPEFMGMTWFTVCE